MDFETYQDRARLLASYPNVGSNPIDPVLGLGEQSGAIEGKVRELMGRYGGAITGDFKYAIAGRLGRVLFWVAQIACELGLSLEDIAQASLSKGTK